MPAFRSWLAYVLLTCFLRVLVPDAWLLALHSHKHTVDAVTAKRQPLLSAQHQHCSVDHFYNVPFQPSAAVALLLPAPTTYAPHRSALRQSVWLHTVAAATHLRGPPARVRFCQLV